MSEPAVYYASGVDGASGRPTPPLTVADVVRRFALDLPEGSRGLPVGADGDDLAELGWALITDDHTDDAVLEALEPLLTLRREQAGRLYRDDIVYRRGLRPRHFLGDLGVSPGPPDVEALPYFVLLVGEPTGVPYTIEHRLDGERAVGRLAFDRLEDYRRYARAVVEYETRSVTPTSLVFPMLHPKDPLTELSTKSLAHPVARRLHAADPASRWIDPEDTDKGRLVAVLREPPSVLFTIGHAARFSSGHRRQTAEQGALLCADWPGPRYSRGPLMPDHLLAAADLPADADLGGLVAYLFACNTTGTPSHDSFERNPAKRRVLAQEPFVSALPKAMLSHPGGPALAVVGHVDQTFAPSYHWPGVGSRVDTFFDVFDRLLDGQRLGHALDSFGDRYQQLATLFLEARDEEVQRRGGDDEMTSDELEELADLWLAYRDARSVSMLGDPAVRLGQVPPRTASDG